MSHHSGWKGNHKVGKGKGRRAATGGHTGDSSEVSESTVRQESLARPVDPNKAKQLLWQWFQKAGGRSLRPAEHCIIDFEQVLQQQGKGRKKTLHVGVAWVWTPDAEDWLIIKSEPQASRRAAEQFAYVQVVQELGLKIPPQFQISEKELAAQVAREQSAQQLQKRQDEEKDRVVAELINRMRKTITKALFGEADSTGGFYTPRETEDEEMPKPVPVQIYLPAMGEVKPADLHTRGDSGGSNGQALRSLAKKEAATFDGLTFFDDSKSTQHNGQMCLSACVFMFEKSIAIIGLAIGPKKNVARAVAARECFTKITGPSPTGVLPTKEDAGEHAQAINELKALQKLHSFKLWCVEGVIAESNEGPWYCCSLRGRVPFNGRLREYKGEGCELTQNGSVASACGDAAERLRKILGCEDCIGWLRQMSRVPMDIDDVPVEDLQNVLADAASCDDSLALKAAYREFERRTTGRLQKGSEFTPVDVSNPPTLTAMQTYEPPDDAAASAARAQRGLPILPVKELRPELAEILSESCVAVVSGGTGSGKSTQIPQYILEDFRPDCNNPAEEWDEERDDGEYDGSYPSQMLNKPPPCRPGGSRPQNWTRPPKILVTEPRRIAAISLAERVAMERGERLGETVGYSVRNDSNPPRASKAGGGTVEYCTVGIVLRRLQNDPTLQDVSHVLIDEVHERDLMTDFLLILLKELLCRRPGDLRVILMSATLDVATFTGYLWDCPSMEVPTGPRFPVQDIHLEDSFFKEASFAQTAVYLLQKEKQAREEAARERAELLEEAQGAGGEESDVDDEIDNGISRNTTGLWWGSAENDDTFITMIVEIIVQLAGDFEKNGPLKDDETGVQGSVLCFLPGWAEIKATLEHLEYTKAGQSLWIVPLHSTLPKEDQQKIFSRPPEGKTKVILGTNIAESAVTIDDVIVIIDAGLMREVSYDPVRRLSTLETVWVSQSSAIQRLGRAGRVRSGRCYRLYSREQFESVPWRSSPEMQRCELTQSCLQALALLREPREFLALAPDPPQRAAVEVALQELVSLGAIAQHDGREEHNRSGPREKMLPLGDVLSRMPVSPTLGRMMIYGGLFGCIDDACLLAAVIAAPRRAFVAPMGKRKESLACQRGFNETSDVLATLMAADYYEAWQYARGKGYAERCAGDLFLVTKRVEHLLVARDGNRDELRRAKLLFGDENAESYWCDDWEDRGGALDADQPLSFSASLGKPLTVEEQEKLLHANEGNTQLRLALLVASYPVNMALKRRPGMAKHSTGTGLEAIVSPQSVNAPPKAKAAQQAKELEDGRRTPSWWSYGSMQISNTQGFLRDVTLVDPIHIALFGGLETLVERGKLREIDGWIELRGNPDALRALASLREKLKECVNLRALGAFSGGSTGVAMPDVYRRVIKEIVELVKAAGPRLDFLKDLLPDHGPNSIVPVPPRPDVVIPRKSLVAAPRWGTKGGRGAKDGGGRGGKDEKGGKDRGRGWTEGKWPSERSGWTEGKRQDSWRGGKNTSEWSSDGGWQWSEGDGWWWA